MAPQKTKRTLLAAVSALLITLAGASSALALDHTQGASATAPGSWGAKNRLYVTTTGESGSRLFVKEVRSDYVVGFENGNMCYKSNQVTYVKPNGTATTLSAYSATCTGYVMGAVQYKKWTSSSIPEILNNYNICGRTSNSMTGATKDAKSWTDWVCVKAYY